LEDKDLHGLTDMPDSLDGGDGNCNDLTAQFFIQYTCEQSPEEQAKKYDIIALCTAIIMFVSFCNMLFIWGLKANQSID